MNQGKNERERVRERLPVPYPDLIFEDGVARQDEAACEREEQEREKQREDRRRRRRRREGHGSSIFLF
jgi:hypothetical protein